MTVKARTVMVTLGDDSSKQRAVLVHMKLNSILYCAVFSVTAYLHAVQPTPRCQALQTQCCLC
jgi:hypothetical protein